MIGDQKSNITSSIIGQDQLKGILSDNVVGLKNNLKTAEHIGSKLNNDDTKKPEIIMNEDKPQKELKIVKEVNLYIIKGIKRIIW